MKTKIASILLLITLCIAAANAQMRYNGGNLSITAPAPNLTQPSHGLNVKNWTTVYFGVDNKGVLRFDLNVLGAHIAGANNQILFLDKQTNTFNNIHVANVYNHSDARAKKDVKNMNSAMLTLLQLRPVTFKWKENTSALKASEAKEGAIPDSLSLPAGTDNGVQYGFLAQEVEEVLPDIVHTEENGEKLVNYTALIPLLVQSVQELQKTVEAQAAMIEQLGGAQGLAKRDAYNKIVSCTPNPASSQVSVETRISENTTSAQLIISSLTGNREMVANVSAAEHTVSMNVSGLTDGIHIVSLYINGQLADSCRLIKE